MFHIFYMDIYTYIFRIYQCENILIIDYHVVHFRENQKDVLNKNELNTCII